VLAAIEEGSMMRSTYRIVVGVDGSEGGRRALRWAVREAARHGGTVQAVSAFQWKGLESVSMGEANATAEREKAEDVLAREVEAAASGIDPAPPIAREAVEGPAPRVLTEAARDADLLVLGSHGHGRIRHAALGSVSEETVRQADCPVVVIPMPHPDRALRSAIPVVRA
jgi:nucleotide-binding universal stress UspA family protein